MGSNDLKLHRTSLDSKEKEIEQLTSFMEKAGSPISIEVQVKNDYYKRTWLTGTFKLIDIKNGRPVYKGTKPPWGVEYMTIWFSFKNVRGGGTSDNGHWCFTIYSVYSADKSFCYIRLDQQDF